MLLRCPYCRRPLTSATQRVAHLADAAACPQRSRDRGTALGGRDDAEQSAADEAPV